MKRFVATAPSNVINFVDPPQRRGSSWRRRTRRYNRNMVPYRIRGGVLSGNITELDSPDNFLDITLTFVVTVREQELDVPVRAKLVIGSRFQERAIEVYPPVWPVGTGNTRYDELQDAVRAYVFAFLNSGRVQQGLPARGHL
jgi:hypothetical protein